MHAAAATSYPFALKEPPCAVVAPVAICCLRRQRRRMLQSRFAKNQRAVAFFAKQIMKRRSLGITGIVL